MGITEKSINEASELLIENEWESYNSDVKFGIETGFAKGVEWANERLKSELLGNPEQLKAGREWISVEDAEKELTKYSCFAGQFGMGVQVVELKTAIEILSKTLVKPSTP